MESSCNFNSHAHCFTIKHVPEHFFDALTWGKHILCIRKMTLSKTYRLFVMLLSSAVIRSLFGIISKDAKKQLKRLHGLVRYGMMENQEAIIDVLSNFYHHQYQLVLLSMDMEYMMSSSDDDKEDPQEDFINQIEQLRSIKHVSKYKNKVLPFIFADPRRDNVTNLVSEYLNFKDAPFQGIKIYPALGYYPFDKHLKDIYKLALDFEVPIIAHCIQGDVYCRKNLGLRPDGSTAKHPIANYSTIPSDKYKLPSNYQLNFTHPLNYECLLNPKHAFVSFGESVDFRNLKICLAHAGGSNEWSMYVDQQHKRYKKKSVENVFHQHPLDLNQKWLGDDTERFNWLTIILALMDEYPNVYFDISFTLHDSTIYPLLRQLLMDKRYNERILFGTDYYVVATEDEEAKLISLMEKELSPDLLKLICQINPKKFLSSKLNPI